jgi:hypothetical protein
MRDRTKGPMVDQAERAVAGALIKHCGMLVETHGYVEKVKAYEKRVILRQVGREQRDQRREARTRRNR